MQLALWWNKPAFSKLNSRLISAYKWDDNEWMKRNCNKNTSSEWPSKNLLLGLSPPTPNHLTPLIPTQLQLYKATWPMERFCSSYFLGKIKKVFQNVMLWMLQHFGIPSLLNIKGECNLNIKYFTSKSLTNHKNWHKFDQNWSRNNRVIIEWEI